MNRQSVVALGLGSATAIVASLVIVSLLDQAVSYPAMIAVLALLLIGVLVREVHVHRHPLTPAGIVAATGLLLFVLRPLTILTNRVTSPGAIADSRFFSPTLVLAGSAALVQCLVFFLVFFLVYYALAARRPETGEAGLLQDGPTIPGPIRQRRVVSTAGLRYLALGASAVAAGGIGYLVLSSGGPAAYFAGLAVRSEFLSGRAFLALAYVPVQIGLVLNVLHRRRAGVRPWDWANIVALTVLVVAGLTAGGRGPLVIGVVLPLVLLKQVGPKPFRLRGIAVMGTGLLVVALTYSIVVRTSNFDQGRSLAELRTDPAAVLLSQLTSGAETRPFDSLVRLNEAAAEDDFELQRGATYAAVPAWFVPRALWADKPNGGGNTWFTREYVPRFYGTARIETSLSAVGEGYANFGYGGVAVAGAAFGALASALRPRRRSGADRSLLAAALPVVLTPLLFSLVRGDLYQGGSLTIATVILTTGAYLLVSTSTSPSATRDGTAPPAPRRDTVLR